MSTLSTFEIYFMWSIVCLFLGGIGIGLVGILANVEKMRRLISTFIINNDNELNPTKPDK